MKTAVNIFKSLADETRLRILMLLQEKSELCVSDLLHALDMPQSTVSRHLAYLKRNKWLHDRRDGIQIYYSIKKDFDPFQKALLVLLGYMLTANTNCRADLERLSSYLCSQDQSNCI